MTDRHIGSDARCRDRLAAMWCDLLTVNQVGPQDNFFMLGGNSILAMHLGQRILDELSCEIPAIELYTVPTFADMCQLVEAHLTERPAAGRRQN
jgi:acyl carrier protein